MRGYRGARVVRGGSWNNTDTNLRGATRNRNNADNENNNNGFRCARPCARCKLYVHGYAGGVRAPDVPAHISGRIQKSVVCSGNRKMNDPAAHSVGIRVVSRVWRDRAADLASPEGRVRYRQRGCSVEFHQASSHEAGQADLGYSLIACPTRNQGVCSTFAIPSKQKRFVEAWRCLEGVEPAHTVAA